MSKVNTLSEENQIMKDKVKYLKTFVKQAVSMSLPINQIINTTTTNNNNNNNSLNNNNNNHNYNNNNNNNNNNLNNLEPD